MTSEPTNTTARECPADRSRRNFAARPETALLYRAFDCRISGSREPRTTVFFDATPEQGVIDRLLALLSLAWNVSPDRICVGDLDSTFEIERNSVEDAQEGIRRWLECGSCGSRPLYAPGRTLLLCNAYNRQKLASAALTIVADLVAAGDVDELHRGQYQAFATNPLIDTLAGDA